MSEVQVGKVALERICVDLGLPQGDAYTQDWAYELGEEYRTESWLHKYFAAYGNSGYGKFELQLLVQLILDVVNDLLQKDEMTGRNAWAMTVDVIRGNFGLHREQVEYWAVMGEAIEDAFALTPLARELLASENSTSDRSVRSVRGTERH